LKSRKKILFQERIAISTIFVLFWLAVQPFLGGTTDGRKVIVPPRRVGSPDGRPPVEEQRPQRGLPTAFRVLRRPITPQARSFLAAEPACQRAVGMDDWNAVGRDLPHTHQPA
jgi:hypothetical protein